MKLLIDFDIVVYRAGYANKHGDYLVAVECADNILMPMLDKYMPCEYEGYLTGKGNFRFEVASIKPYKGNRDEKQKPRYYKDLREYLIDFWGAKVVNGKEADDEMGVQQDEDTIICSIDKDMMMIPGYHYNFVKGEEVYVSPEDGVYNFLRQMLVGDTSDNIMGITGIGAVKSEKLLKGLSPKEQLAVVQGLYKKQYGEEWEKAFHEVATLLWIQRAGALTYKDCRLLYD